MQDIAKLFSLSLRYHLHQTNQCSSKGTVNKRLLEIFTASSITDLKLYFFLGETMKHKKERERVGEITDTADIKTQQGDTARQAAQHRQIAEEPNALWDYTMRLHKLQCF